VRRLVAASVAASALTIAACGSGSSASTGSALVDPNSTKPINTLDVDPSGDGLLLTTSKGLFHITEDRATHIDSVVDTPDGSSPVGHYLAIYTTGNGDELIGSGHPDSKKKVAGFLGLLRSENGGKTWQTVSRYGIADLHVIRVLDGNIYAYDAFLPGVIESTDNGKTWSERTAPPTRVIDMVVDPSDPSHLIISTKQALFRSTDGGESWSAVASASAASLEWPDAEDLYRADDDGLVYVSHDHADSWQIAGHIDGSPRAMKAVSPTELYVALADATIVHSTDGGKTWDTYFSP
jgi:BNR/Asp-box repeat